MATYKNYGNVRQDINKLLPIITNKLFPELASKYSIRMNTKPVTLRRTFATYTGEGLSNARITLEFSSNHEQIQDYAATDLVLFVKAYYDTNGEDAGIIDLSNIPDTASQIYATLYELGYRTAEDAEKEKQDREAKAAEEKRQKLEREKKKKEALQAELAAEEKEKEQEPEEQEPAVDETKASIEEFSNQFDRYLSAMTEINDKMMITISSALEDGHASFITVDATYITASMCLVETNGISPKVDKAVKWASAKKYCIAVTEKLQGAISITAVDAKGKDIELPADKSVDDGVDLGINID